MTRVPQTIGRVVLVLAVGLSLLAACASLAYGVPATFAPASLVSYTFDSGGQTFPVIVPIPATPSDFYATAASWGPITSASHSGTTSLWCAGTGVGGHNYWSTYPGGTRGYAQVSLSALADYYSSSVKFWYLMPSLGQEDKNNDAFSLEISNSGESAYTIIRSIPLVSSWTAYSHSLSVPSEDFSASRQATVFKLRFFDFQENSVETPNGQGPAIDDFQILAYKYGAPRSLGVAGDVNGHAVLTWSAPARATGTTSNEDRPITYRVWRTETNQDLWTERTSSASRISALTYTDEHAEPGVSYQYVVQAWDQGAGDGYGEVPTAVTWPIQSTSVTTPSAPSSVRTWKTYSVAGTINPAPSGATTVGIELSRDKSIIATPVVVSVASGAYSGSVRFPQSGTWYIRAKYVDASHSVMYSPWGTVTSSSAVTISAPTGKTTMTHNKTYTVTGSISPAHTSAKYLRLFAYRYSGTTKVQTLSFTVKVSNTGMPAGTTKYSASVKLTKKGTWKLRAEHLAHGSSPVEGTTWSSYSSKITAK